MTKYIFMHKKILATLVAFMVVGCGGGYKPDPAQVAAYQRHGQLADAFVTALNTSGEYTVALVKTHTKQTDYIVILDADTNEYTAVNIGDYDPNSSSAVEFLNGATIYEDLDYMPGYYSYSVYEYYDYSCECYMSDVDETWHEDTYRDRWTGISFEKTTEVSKDVALFAQIAEEAVVNSRAIGVSEKFGLSVERSKDVVRLSLAWQKAGGKDMTDNDQDTFSNELLGFSITEAKRALKAKAEGVNEPVNDLIERAAEKNDTTPEHVKNLIDGYIGQ